MFSPDKMDGLTVVELRFLPLKVISFYYLVDYTLIMEKVGKKQTELDYLSSNTGSISTLEFFSQKNKSSDSVLNTGSARSLFLSVSLYSIGRRADRWIKSLNTSILYEEKWLASVSNNCKMYLMYLQQ